jgi:pimeloyl-ACP methyl ester carboxylesterase
MSAIIVDGSVVHYEMIGRGKPVLFLHGWLGSWRYWMPTMITLADKYRAYALDLWGFGDSDKSKPRYQVSDYVALVDSFVSMLGIEKPALIGHALGGVVALEYAACYPERVQKIMAINLPMHADCINPKLLNYADNSLVGRLMRWRQQIPYQEVQGEAEKTGQGAIKTSLQSVAQIDIYRRLQAISQQEQTILLAVYGENDDVIEPEPIYRMNGNWPNIRPIGLPESKHFPMLDQAPKFNRLLDDFLGIEADLSSLALKEEWRRRTR